MISYFVCGNIAKDRGCFIFYVVKLSDLYDKIIPFFKTNEIFGAKNKDFKDFKDFKDWWAVAELMKQSKHLTPEGLNRIIQIKQGMNLKRPWK